MPIEHADIPYSDAWWLRRLAKSMNARPTKLPPQLRDSRCSLLGRRDWMDLIWSYYLGDYPLPRINRQHRDATREFLRMARANFGLLTVEAMLDRTTLLGVRTGADGDSDGDNTARKIMAANGSWIADTHAFTFTLGRGYTMVDEPAEGAEVATITAEDPRQVIVSLDPVRTDHVRAALKTYYDEDESEEHAHVFLPAGRDPVTGDELGDRVRVAVRKGRSLDHSRFTPSSWEWDEDRSGDLAVQGFGVPIVPYINRLGMGEFEPHLDLLDRIYNMIADRLWMSKFQVFRQRALEQAKDAIDLPKKDPETGKEIDYDEVFEADPGALWDLPAGYTIWESQTTDLSPMLSAVKDDVREYSAVTRTPLYMYNPSEGGSGSAEGATLQREGLVFKCEDRMTRLTPSHLRTYRLGFAYSGKPELANGELVPIWAPAERYSLQQRGDAAAKAQDVPWEDRMTEVWQFQPDVVARMKKNRARDLLFQPPTPPTPPPAPPTPPPTPPAPPAPPAGG